MSEMIKESIMQAASLNADNITTVRIAGKDGVRDLDWQQTKVALYDKIKGVSQISKSDMVQLTASIGAGVLKQEKDKGLIQG